MTPQDVISGSAPWAIVPGDCLRSLRVMPADTFHACVTSPPYFRLRSYLPQGSPLKEFEIGQEPTPAEFVASQVEVFAEVRRVLRPDGVLWLNLGDSYASGHRKGHGTPGRMQQGNRGSNGTNDAERVDAGLPSGNLVGIPWRVALALQEDGWNLRCAFHWIKPSAMPSSVIGTRWQQHMVRDPAFRLKRYAGKGIDQDVNGSAERMKANTATARANGAAHNNGAAGISSVGWIACPGCPKCSPNNGLVLRRGSWRYTSAVEYVFMLTKGPGYFADQDAIRTPLSDATLERDQYTRIIDDPDEEFAVAHDHETIHTAGANPRDWGIISPEPQKLKHYASYPTGLIEPFLRVSTSLHGCCQECGAPWARIVSVKSVPHPQPGSPSRPEVNCKGGVQANGACNLAPETETLGWKAMCGCRRFDAVPALVLDPFCGTATTGIVASRLGLRFVGCELSEEYVAMGTKRLRDEMPLFSKAATP